MPLLSIGDARQKRGEAREGGDRRVGWDEWPKAERAGRVVTVDDLVKRVPADTLYRNHVRH